MSLDIWLEYPCPDQPKESLEVFSCNITHNLSTMAAAAGCYKVMWRPEEIGVSFARDAVPLLQNGLNRLTCDPEQFAQYSPTNGWGTYDGLVDVVRRYLDACKKYPGAAISIWR